MNLVKKIFLLLSIFVATGIASANKEVHLVTGIEEFPPLTGKSLPSGGLFTEITMIVFQRLGYKPNVDYEGWVTGKDTLTLMRNAYIATFPYVKEKSREKLFIYSSPVYSASRFLYKRAGDPLKFSDLKSSSSPTGKLGCRPVGYHLNDLKPLMDRNLITIQQPKTLDDCFKKLVNKKVDFVVAIDFVGDRKVSENKFQDLVKKDIDPIGEDDFHLIFPRTDMLASTYVNGFNKELAKMEQSGELDRIIEAQLALYYRSLRQ